MVPVRKDPPSGRDPGPRCLALGGPGAGDSDPDVAITRRSVIAATLALSWMPLATAGCGLAMDPGADGPETGDQGEAVVIVASGTSNEPAPGLSDGISAVLRRAAVGSTPAVAVLVSPQAIPSRLPLTPRRANGRVEYGPGRTAMIEDNLAQIADALARMAATAPRFDLLAQLSSAARAWPRPATLVVVSSGLSSSGALDLRQVGWAAQPGAVARQLAARGFLPRLGGWRILLSGLGSVAGPQPALPEPCRTKLESYWKEVCKASGGASCTVDDSLRLDRPPLGRVPVPIVPVPTVSSVTGAAARQDPTIHIPAALLFDLDRAALRVGTDAVLRRVAVALASSRVRVMVVGHADASSGTRAHNRALSLARARAVASRLIDLGVPAAAIVSVRGVGSDDHPLAAELTAGHPDPAKIDGWRRVDLHLMAPASFPN